MAPTWDGLLVSFSGMDTLQEALKTAHCQMTGSM